MIWNTAIDQGYDFATIDRDRACGLILTSSSRSVPACAISPERGRNRVGGVLQLGQDLGDDALARPCMGGDRALHGGEGAPVMADDRAGDTDFVENHLACGDGESVAGGLVDASGDLCSVERGTGGEG